MVKKFKKRRFHTLSLLVAAGLSLQTVSVPVLATEFDDSGEQTVLQAPQSGDGDELTVLPESVVDTLAENDVDVQGIAEKDKSEHGTDWIVVNPDDPEASDGRVDRSCVASLENMVAVLNSGDEVKVDLNDPLRSALTQNYEGTVQFNVDLSSLFRTAEDQWQQVLDLHFGRPDSWRVMGPNNSQATVELEVKLPDGFSAGQGESVCNSRFLEKITTEPGESEDTVKITVYLTEMEYIDKLMKAAQAGTAGNAQLSIPIQGKIEKGEVLNQKVEVSGGAILEHITGFMIPLSLNVHVDPLEAPLFGSAEAFGSFKASEKTDGTSLKPGKSDDTDVSAESQKQDLSNPSAAAAKPAAAAAPGGGDNLPLNYSTSVSLYGNMNIEGSYRKDVEPGEAFTVSSYLSVSEIAEVMNRQISRQEQFYDDVLSAQLQNTDFRFTADYSFPRCTDLSQVHAELEGENNPFTVLGTSVSGRRLTVTFAMKDEPRNVRELQEMAQAAGDMLTLNISGARLTGSSILTNTDLQIVGDVEGYLRTDVLPNSETTLRATVNFDMPETREAAVRVLETVEFEREYAVGGWIAPDEEYYWSYFRRRTGVPFAMKGCLDTGVIRSVLNSCRYYGRAAASAPVNVSVENLEFTAEFLLPEGMDWIGQGSQAVLKDTDDFKVISAKKQGSKVIVKMGLSEETEIDDLWDLFSLADRTPETLELSLEGFVITEDCSLAEYDREFIIRGKVSGTFEAFAEDHDQIPHHITLGFNGEEMEHEGDLQFAVIGAAPYRVLRNFDLSGRMSLSHKATNKIADDETFGFTSTLDVSSISEKFSQITENYEAYYELSQVTMDHTDFGFRAVYTFPNGVNLSDVTASLEEDSPFTVSDIAISENTLTVQFNLKKQPKNVGDLCEVAEKTGTEMVLTVDGVKADPTVRHNRDLHITGAVSGHLNTNVNLDVDSLIRPTLTFSIPDEECPSLTFQVVERQSVRKDIRIPVEAFVGSNLKESKEVQNGANFSLTCKMDSTAIAEQIQALRQSQSYLEKTGNAALEIQADFTLPDQVRWTGNASNAKVIGSQALTVTDVQSSQGAVHVKLALKDSHLILSLQNFEQAIRALNAPITIELGGFTLDSNAKDAQLYQIHASVQGKVLADLSGCEDEIPYRFEGDLVSESAPADLVCWVMHDYKQQINLGTGIAANDKVPGNTLTVQEGSTVTVRAHLSTKPLKDSINTVSQEQGKNAAKASLSNPSLTLSTVFTLPDGFTWNGTAPTVDGMRVTSSKANGKTVTISYALDLSNIKTFGDLKGKIDALPNTVKISLPGVTTPKAGKTRTYGSNAVDVGNN